MTYGMINWLGDVRTADGLQQEMCAMRFLKKIVSISLVAATLMGCAHAVTMSDGTKCEATGFVNREPCYYGSRPHDQAPIGETPFPKEATYHADPGSLALGSLGVLIGPPFGWAGAFYIFGWRTFQPEKDHPHQ